MPQDNNRIWLSSPHLGGAEKRFIKEALRENWVAPLGPNVDGFEQDLENYLGQNVKVAALSSGTAALHLALVLSGVGVGDEVLCQSFTFSASANPIIYQAATPIFVDSELQTWNMSPDCLETAIHDRIRQGKKPKAIIVVHLYGMPAQVDKIAEIARRHEIFLIEDAAEALGSTYKGRRLGTFGDFGILSFNGNKIITTSGGGALVSKNEELIKKARFLSTQARDPAPHYQHSHIGYNYRLSNICAGIGRGQMKVIEQRVRQRRKNFDFYVKALQEHECVEFLKEPTEDYYSNRWLTTLMIKKHDINKIILHLASKKIECRPLWKPMHLQPVFAGYPFYGNQTCESLFSNGLCLPSGSNLTRKDLNSINEQLQLLLS